MQRPRPVAAVVFVWSLWGWLAACGPSDGSDPSAGTGSAGGNPLSVSFEAQEDPDQDDLAEWGDPTLRARMQRLGVEEEGGCVLQPEAQPIERPLPFGRGAQLELSAPYPCAVELRAAQGEPLLSLPLRLGELDVDLGPKRLVGVVLRLDRPELLEQSQAVFVVLDLGQLLEGIQPDTIAAWLAQGGQDESWQEALAQNLGRALKLHIDPTPEDGQLTRSARTPDTELGGVELLLD